MTTDQTYRTDARSSFDDHICYRSGNWIRYCDLKISVDDIGFRQGVVAVERLRTYSGQPHQVDAHLNRWQHTAKVLRIDGLPSTNRIEQVIVDLLKKNESLVKDRSDVGITIFATPGSSATSDPTFAVHLNPIDHDLVRSRRANGQPLIVTNVEQPSAASWPRSIKVRSRIHYYLADAEARGHDADAVGVLIDSVGNITETSIANLAIVQSGQIISPSDDTVLGGITQMVLEQIAEQLMIRWEKRAISGEEFGRADEVLLMGTDGGIWYASSVDGRPIGKEDAGPVYTLLQHEFDSISR